MTVLFHFSLFDIQKVCGWIFHRTGQKGDKTLGAVWENIPSQASAAKTQTTAKSNLKSFFIFFKTEFCSSY